MSPRVLVIGSGSIGRRHATNLRGLGADVTIADVDPTRLELLDAPSIDLDEGIPSGFDAVVVASPTTLHVEHATAALATTGAVFVEKPLGVTPAECDALLATGGDRLVVGYNLRFHAPVRRVVELVHDGRAGVPLSYRLWFGQWLPDWRPDVDYRRTYSARADLGGGVLSDAIHELDLAVWLAGADLRVEGAVVARLGPLEIDVEDTVRALLTNADGVPIGIELDYLARQYRRGMEIVGDRATVTFDWASGEVSIREPEGTTVEHFDVPLAESYVAEMREFLEFVRSGATPTNTAVAGRESVRLATAIRAAAEAAP